MQVGEDFVFEGHDTGGVSIGGELEAGVWPACC